MSSGRRSYIFLLDYLGLTVVLLLLIAGFSVFTENFFTLTNFRTIVNQTPDAVVIAVGMTFVLIIAGIDLSVGSVLGLSEAVLAVCLHRFGLPMPVGIAACLGTGLLCGVLHGATNITRRLPSFIWTLACRDRCGGAYLVTNSRSITGTHSEVCFVAHRRRLHDVRDRRSRRCCGADCAVAHGIWTPSLCDRVQ